MSPVASRANGQDDLTRLGSGLVPLHTQPGSSASLNDFIRTLSTVWLTMSVDRYDLPKGSLNLETAAAFAEGRVPVQPADRPISLLGKEWRAVACPVRLLGYIYSLRVVTLSDVRARRGRELLRARPFLALSLRN